MYQKQTFCFLVLMLFANAFHFSIYSIGFDVFYKPKRFDKLPKPAPDTRPPVDISIIRKQQAQLAHEAAAKVKKSQVTQKQPTIKKPLLEIPENQQPVPTLSKPIQEVIKKPVPDISNKKTTIQKIKNKKTNKKDMPIEPDCTVNTQLAINGIKEAEGLLKEIDTLMKKLTSVRELKKVSLLEFSTQLSKLKTKINNAYDFMLLHSTLAASKITAPCPQYFIAIQNLQGLLNDVIRTFYTLQAKLDELIAISEDDSVTPANSTKTTEPTEKSNFSNKPQKITPTPVILLEKEDLFDPSPHDNAHLLNLTDLHIENP